VLGPQAGDMIRESSRQSSSFTTTRTALDRRRPRRRGRALALRIRVWWYYDQMEEPNKHFADNWAQEDELVKAVDAFS
jgi:hypothetical protein